MRLPFRAFALSILLACSGRVNGGDTPSYTVDQAVAIAAEKNPEIVIARKKVEAARGGVVEARAGFLPSVSSVGLVDKRQAQRDTRLRDEDYSTQLRVQQNLYTGGQVTNQLAIARLNLDKAECDLQETVNRVAMDTRVAYSELLLNRAKIRVRENSVRVLEEELKNQQERLRAGLAGNLNVQRAQVAIANEQPQLITAQSDLHTSYLRLGELFGMEWPLDGTTPPFDVVGQLQYQPRHPVLSECLARALAERPSIRAAQYAVEVEDRQYVVDKSELRPHVGLFSAYEVYNERDPEVGPEFNHGYVVGISGTWHIFDGFATKGRMQATRARRDAAAAALEAARRGVASEVRSAFFDLDQAQRVLESETNNVQTADQSLEIAKSNLAAGLGTQLDVLQAATDVTRTRSTRLSAIHLHNAALARLARACACTPDALDFPTAKRNGGEKVSKVAEPPQNLSRR